MLTLDVGLTFELFSPGDALCEDGHYSEDEEVEDADEEMQQLLPCLATLDLQVMLLDDEVVAHEDDLGNEDDSVRREFQPDRKSVV